MRRFFVFDVESVGLYGDPFAVGWVVMLENGIKLEEGLMSCLDKENIWPGDLDDMAWVRNNVPAMDRTHQNIGSMLCDFWEVYLRNKECTFAADCPFPVETRFLNRLLADNRSLQRLGPYPLIDVASVALAAGLDPLAVWPRNDDELPVHNPLCDARQSARLLCDALNRVRRP